MQRERLFFPELALPQSPDGGSIPGITCQMVPAEALDGQDLSLGQQPSGSSDVAVFSIRDSTFALQEIAGPAGRAGDRLRMKPPVFRVAIFASAQLVQQPVFHRGVRTVVRQTQQNGVAGPAIGAIDVGIAVARIGWIEQFFQAIVANRQVGGNARAGMLPMLALANRELAEAHGFGRLDFHVGDVGGRRKLALQAMTKASSPLSAPSRWISTPASAIQYPSPQRMGAARGDRRTGETQPLAQLRGPE